MAALCLSAALFVALGALSPFFSATPYATAPVPPAAHQIFVASDSAVKALATGLAACREKINLAAFDIQVDQLGQLFSEVMHTHPELFHVGRQLGYTCLPSGQVISITPVYLMDGQALTDARRLYRETVEDFCKLLDSARRSRTTAAWTQADTALFLHDWLASRYDYDTSGTRFDVYSLFSDGTGVCQAYALAFLALGQAVGLEVDVVTSVPMDHAWNHVRIDGKWYHVDVTRDDPIRPDASTADPPTQTTVHHDRLLLSDSALQALGYHDYTCSAGHICTDKSFEAQDGTARLTAQRVVLTSLPNGWFEYREKLLTPIDWPPAKESVDAATAVATATAVTGDINRDGILNLADILTLRDFGGDEDDINALRHHLLDIIAGE